MPNFGVRAGYVWRGSATSTAATTSTAVLRLHGAGVGSRSGPDGRVGNRDDGAPLARSIWRRNTAACRRQSQINVDDSDRITTPSKSPAPSA
jgi:hypothetical protein